MPELPEVEIVKRSLKNKLNFKKIKKVIINNIIVNARIARSRNCKTIT